MTGKNCCWSRATGCADWTTARSASNCRQMKWPTWSATGSTRPPMNSYSRSCVHSPPATKSTQVTCSRWAALNSSCAKCASLERNKRLTRTICFTKMTSTAKYLFLTAEMQWLAGHAWMTTTHMTTHSLTFANAQDLSSGCTWIVSSNGSSPNYTSKLVKIQQHTTIKISHVNSVQCLIPKA